MNNSTRVIVNTGFLYANMIVTLVVQLWAVKLVLNALGETDYGIYSIIANIVSLCAFMNVAMAAATQRFFSYELGKNDSGELKETFYQSMVLHLSIGALVIILLEGAGIYYIQNILNAPAERLEMAQMLLHCIAISTAVNIVMVPYEGMLNAHENMGTIASINIIDALLKLGIALYLGHASADRLLVYGLLTIVCTLITFSLKRYFCTKHYSESRFKFHKINDWSKLKQITSFAGWNFIGTSCGLARYQGTAIILNNFFGILINAAYGIAQQVNACLLFFANTIVRAIRPQIVKSEGSGDRERMLRLATTTCKITSILVAILGIPLYIEMEFVLNLWLGTATEYSVMFCRAFIVIVFINQLTIGLQIAIESVGKIRLLQIVVGSMHIMALPIGFLLLKMGFAANSIMLCIIIEELVCIGLRTWIAQRQTALKGNEFILRTVLPCMLTVGASFVALHLLHNMLAPMSEWLSVISVGILNVLILSAVTYLFILSKAEQSTIRQFVQTILVKLHLSK